MLQALKSVTGSSKTATDKVEISDYTISPIDNEQLNTPLTNNPKPAKTLLKDINDALKQGILPEAQFIELLSNDHYAKKLGSLASKINKIYNLIITIYCDHFTSLYQEYFQKITVKDLCDLPNSAHYKKLQTICDNLRWHVETNILGYSSLETCEARTIPEKKLQYQRTLRLQLWLDIANELKFRHNDAAYYSVTRALFGSNLLRLKLTIEGLSDRSKSLYRTLSDHYDQMASSRVSGQYLQKIIPEAPVIPDVERIYFPIRRVAQEESEVAGVGTGIEPIWKKISRTPFSSDVKMRLLLEQHHVFAKVIPVLNFLMTEMSALKSRYRLPEFTLTLLTPHYDDVTDAIAEELEPKVESVSNVVLNKAPVKITIQQVPKDLFRIEKPETDEESESRETLDNWLLKNYYHKFITLLAQLKMLAVVKDQLLEATTLKKEILAQHKIPFEEIVENLYVVHVLRQLGETHGFNIIPVSQSDIATATQLITSLDKVLKQIGRVYEETQSDAEKLRLDTIKNNSIKRDIKDLHDTCLQLLLKLSEFIKMGHIHDLEQTKKTFVTAHNLIEKHYPKFIAAMTPRADDIDTVTNEYQPLKQRFDELRILFIAKEQRYLLLPPIITDILVKHTAVLTELTAKYAQMAEKNLPFIASNVIEDIKTLKNMLLELPYAVDNSPSSDPEVLSKISTLKKQIQQLIDDCKRHLKKANKQIETSKLPIRSEDSTQIAALIKHSPLVNPALPFPVIKKLLPSGITFGKPQDFFSALGEMLNFCRSADTYTEKYLRQACHKFYLINKTTVDEWLKSGAGVITVSINYDRVQFTESRMIKLFRDNRDTLKGNYNIEGRILCHACNIKSLFIVAINSIRDRNPVTYYRVDPDGTEQIAKFDIEDYLSRKIPVLICQAEHYHVPRNLPTHKDTIQPRVRSATIDGRMSRR